VIDPHAEAADLRLVCDEFGRFDAPADGRTLRVRTKADRSAPGDASDTARVCAISGEGLDELRAAIADRLRSAEGFGESLPWSVASALRACLSAIESARAIAGAGEAELIADRLRASLDEVGSITGSVAADDVLGRIFSSFCVGK
jgi:tRNA modification GTPase